MTGAIRHSSAARRLLGGLALLVLAIQMLMPSGFMPVRTDKGVIVTLCTGQGAVNIIVDRDSAPGSVLGPDDHRPDDKMAGKQPCAFAASVQPVLPPLSLADLFLPAWTLSHGPVAFAVKTGMVARLAAPPPPSSGPPRDY